MEAGNNSLFYNTYDFATPLGRRDRHADAPATGILVLRVLALPLMVDLIEIENEFVVAQVLCQKLAIPVDDSAPDPRISNRDSSFTGNKLPVILGVHDLVIVEATQKRSCPGQDDCGEKIEPESVTGLHSVRIYSVGLLRSIFNPS